MSHSSKRWLSLPFAGPLTLAIRFLLLSSLVFIAACGGAQGGVSPSGASGAFPGAAPAAPAVVPASAPAAAPGAPAPAQGQAALPAANKSPSGANQSTNPATADVAPFNRMVIRNAKLTLQVPDVEVALRKVREIADANGGYVTASHSYFTKDGDRDQMVADVTIAVRADAYDRAVQSIRQAATKVENEDGTSQDVTDQYVDLDAQLRNLQASEDAILKLTQKADRLEDVLTLQRELANVRGQIERIQGQERLLQNETSMATISVNLHLPPAIAPPPALPVWNPALTFERGWHASLIALEAFADLLISVVSFSWWLTPFVILGILAYRRTRRTAVVVPPPAAG